MADNVTADAGAGGATLAMREVTHGGDTAQLAGAWIAGITGTEGSYVFEAINGSAVNGLEVDVTRLSALVASTAEIGNVKNSGAFLVQEDGAALTSLQLIDDIVQVEDAVHNSGDSGVMALAVRNDTLASLVSADGDYAPLQVNAEGAIFTREAANLIESGNSTTTPLGSGASFIGTTTDVLSCSGISVFLDSDQDSAVDGMTFEFSSDGTNFDDIKVFTYTAVNGARTFQFGIQAQFFRVIENRIDRNSARSSNPYPNIANQV